MPRFTEEVRSSQHPGSDWVAEKTGNPTLGHPVELGLKFGRASGDALQALSVRRWSIGRPQIDASSDLADMLEHAPSLTSSAAAADKGG
jgi:hypothetical protein